MNLFTEYQKKIFNCLKKLEKKKILKIPSNLNFTVEIPPKNQKGDISCNIAMILSKINNKAPNQIALDLKKYFLLNFSEFKNIDIAGPGFMNIFFHESFWKEYLKKIIKLDSKFGSNKALKKNIT